MEGDDEYVWDHYENSVKVIIVEESSDVQAFYFDKS